MTQHATSCGLSKRSSQKRDAMARRRQFSPILIIKSLFFLILLSFSIVLPAQTQDADSDLIAKFVQSHGPAVTFDASNIKQFWVSNTVSSQKDHICILLDNGRNNPFESVPLKIQLANVNEEQDCKVEVLTETSGVGFSVLDSQEREISKSVPQEQFINYDCLESTFHLEDTRNYTFYIRFSSSVSPQIKIKAIILSFTKNPGSKYVFYPQVVKISKDDSDTFTLTGKSTVFTGKKLIHISDNEISTSVKVKNTGEQATRVYIGYSSHAKDQTRINCGCYPLNDNNNLLTVISAEKDSSSIIVDSCPEWKKNCPIALNAKEDMSDIPNQTLTEGRIVEVIKLDDGNMEIKLNKPIKEDIQKGSTIRIHSADSSNLYLSIKVLQPGEEETFSTILKKDEKFIQERGKYFVNDIYFVRLMILSSSIDSKEESTIAISNGTLSTN